MNNKIKIAISCGDYNGIGPEVLIKSFNDQELYDSAYFQIAAHKIIFQNVFESFNKEFRENYKTGYNNVLKSLIDQDKMFTVKEFKFLPGKPDRISGEYAYNSLNYVINLWKDSKTDIIVTLPVTKKYLFPPDLKFSGQTEWIADKIGNKDSLMLMVKDKIKIAVATTHIPVSDVAKALTSELIITKGKLLLNTLHSDFNIQTPKIAITGLNPHSGEMGTIGKEEIDVITPAINELNKYSKIFYGPHSADTLFVDKNITKYDAILAMYHDQGLIPFKIYSRLSGVNFTAGIKIIRTSPDHGTALDIAGKGEADHGGIKEAIIKGKEFFVNRKSNETIYDPAKCL